MYKEDLKQSLIWHSNLSYDDNFLETRSGMDHRGLVWKQLWKMTLFWSEIVSGLWQPGGTPQQEFLGVPLREHSTRVVSRRKHWNRQHFHQTSIFFLFKKYTQCLRYLTLSGQKFPRHSLYSLSWFIWRGCHLTLLGVTYRIMQPRCQANEFYKNYNGRNDEGQSERSNTLRRPAVFSYQADCYFLGIITESFICLFFTPGGI